MLDLSPLEGGLEELAGWPKKTACASAEEAGWLEGSLPSRHTPQLLGVELCRRQEERHSPHLTAPWGEAFSLLSRVVT